MDKRESAEYLIKDITKEEMTEQEYDKYLIEKELRPQEKLETDEENNLVKFDLKTLSNKNLTEGEVLTKIIMFVTGGVIIEYMLLNLIIGKIIMPAGVVHSAKELGVLSMYTKLITLFFILVTAFITTFFIKIDKHTAE